MSAASSLVRACPICSGSTDRVFLADGYWVRACRDCGHRVAELETDRRHVETTYGDAYFNGGGAGYPGYLDEADLLRRAGRSYARIAGRHMPVGSVLDVGAAAGFILESFVRAGWHGVGLEPNPGMAAHARDALGLDVRTGTLEDVTFEERFDLVTMIQVLPHLWDIERALANAAASTVPGGHWLIETWDRDSWTARIMGRRWHEYSPPSVLHWFTREGVARLSGRYGFRPIARGRPRKRIQGAHAVSLLAESFRSTPVAGAIQTLRGLVPSEIPYPSEDVFWILLRKDGQAG